MNKVWEIGKRKKNLLFFFLLSVISVVETLANQFTLNEVIRGSYFLNLYQSSLMKKMACCLNLNSQAANHWLKSVFTLEQY